MTQSPNVVYQSLYNNAAAAAAFQFTTNQNSGFFNQFPQFYGSPAIAKTPFQSAFQSCSSSASSSNSSVVSNNAFNNSSQKRCRQDEMEGISTNVIVIPEPKPQEIFSKSFNGFDISAALNQNSIKSALMPKSNGVKIANGDYYVDDENRNTVNYFLF